jgi:hypothetical protein
MPLDTVLGFAALAAVTFLIVALVWTVLRRRGATGTLGERVEGVGVVGEGHSEDGERLASPVSEQIEEAAQRKLAGYPDLAGKRLDFGTAGDGSLEIWFDDVRYESVDQIPDARVREALAEAVKSFNQ